MGEKRYKLKKDAIPFMQEKYRCEVQPMEYWKRCEISETTLDEVVDPYITYCGDNIAHFLSVDIPFVIHFPQMSRDEYKKFSSPQEVQKLTDHILEYLRPLSQTDDTQRAKLDVLKSIFYDAICTITDHKFSIQSPSNPMILDSNVYELLDKHDIKPSDLYFNNICTVEMHSIEEFTKISDYGVFGDGIYSFDCSQCYNLTNLEGSPSKVGGSFDCSNCYNLTSIDGAPEIIGRNFDCRNCKNLTSLQGTPEKVSGVFDCRNCNPNFINLVKQKYGVNWVENSDFRFIKSY